jgi:hypothetical protein
MSGPQPPSSLDRDITAAIEGTTVFDGRGSGTAINRHLARRLMRLTAS